MKKLLAAALALVAAAGCTRAPSVQEVQEGISRATETIATEGQLAATGTANMAMTESVLGGISTIGGLSRVNPSEMDPVRLLETLDPRKLAVVQAPLRSHKEDARIARSPDSDPGDEFRTAMHALRDFLRTRIFTEANVEERTGNATIFRITGEDICAAGDSACVTAFDRFEVRISASRDTDSLDLTLLIGPDRNAPFRIQLSENAMGAMIDLGEARATYLYVAGVVGEETVGLPEVMQGQFEVRVQRHGEHDYSLSLHVPQAILVERTDATAGGLYRISTGAKSPLASVRYDDVNKRLAGSLDIGVTEYGYPYSPVVSETGNAGERMLTRIGGASWSFDFTDGDTTANITNIGLGDVSSVQQLDGVTLQSIDVNSSSGRRFALAITPNAAGRAVVTVNPGLDVSVLFFREPLTVDADVYVAPWEMDETLRVSFSGTNPTLEDVPSDGAGFPGGLKVVSGVLALSTTHTDYGPVVVEAGQCLISNPSPEVGSHGVLGDYQVVACP